MHLLTIKQIAPRKWTEKIKKTSKITEKDRVKPYIEKPVRLSGKLRPQSLLVLLFFAATMTAQANGSKGDKPAAACAENYAKMASPDTPVRAELDADTFSDTIRDAAWTMNKDELVSAVDYMTSEQLQRAVELMSLEELKRAYRSLPAAVRKERGAFANEAQLREWVKEMPVETLRPHIKHLSRRQLREAAALMTPEQIRLARATPFGKAARRRIAAKLKLEAHKDSLRMQDVFRLRTTRRGTRTLNFDEAAQKKYQEYFDEMWNLMIKAGELREWELKDYRRYLKKKGGIPYPVIDADQRKALLAEMIEQENRTLQKMLGTDLEDEVTDRIIMHDDRLYAYFEDRFEEYTLETLKHNKTLDDFIADASPSRLRRLAKVFSRNAKSLSKYAGTGLLGALMFATFSTLLDPIKSNFFEPIKESQKEAVKSIKEAAKSVIPTNWSAYFKNGKEGFNDAMFELISTYYALTFTKVGEIKTKEERGAGQNLLQKQIFRSQNAIGQFKKLMDEKNPQFQTKLQESIKQLGDNLTAELTALRGYEAAKAVADASETGRKPLKDKQKLEEVGSDLADKIAQSERALAGMLADWMLYRQLSGKKIPQTSYEADKEEDALERKYQDAYMHYINNNDLDTLKKAFAQEMYKMHAELLEMGKN